MRKTSLLLALSFCLFSAPACARCDSGPLSLGEPKELEGRTVAELFVPFDADRADLVGPDDHSAMYGKMPEIIAIPSGDELDVLVQDHADPDVRRAVWVRVAPTGGAYAITRSWEVPIVDRIMGFSRDERGAYFVASGIEEARHREVTAKWPRPGSVRRGIVHVAKMSEEGEGVFEVDLDHARASAFEGAEPLINPGVASTSRLLAAGGVLALVHGNNTVPDDAGVRHQKAVGTYLDAETGELLRASSIWVSHSFDQRLLFDGRGIVELHLGDAFPRQIVFARVEPDSGSYPLFHNKGAHGNNNTFARLGNFALVHDDPAHGLLAVFVAERSEGDTLLHDHGRVAGIRDVAMVRVEREFEARPRDEMGHLDPSLPDTLSVTAGQSGERENRLRWLTDHGGLEALTHAERPKLVAVGEDRYIVLFERWARAEGGYEFEGTYAISMNAHGDAEVPAARVSDHHLPRGDDAFALGGRAAWVTGDRTIPALFLHFVDHELAYERVIVE